MKTAEEYKNQINSVQIAFKKVGYKSVELIYHFNISGSDCIYWVMRGGKCVLKSFFLEDAVNKFHSIQKIEP